MNKFDTNSTPNEVLIQQLENLPDEILDQPRFFAVNKAKEPLTKGWSKPDNQKHYTEIEGYKGFDTAGHDRAEDYLFLDFDHIFTDAGQFVNVLAEDWFNMVVDALKTYCELSASLKGAHVIAVPTAGKFPKVASGKNGRIYFDDEKKSFVEIFYGTGGRYCFFTGNVYRCEPKAAVAHGQPVDDVFKTLLDEVATQNKKPQKSTQQKPTATPVYQSTNSPDFDIYRAEKMLEVIRVADLSREDWLNVGMALKNNGNTCADWEQWSRPDERFKDGECDRLWQGFNGSGLTIATIHDLAKQYGYDEKEIQREWYQLHPEFSNKKSHAPRADSKPIDLTQSDDDSQATADDDMEAYIHGFTTDLGNAERLERFCGNAIRWMTDAEKWLIWQPTGIWKLYSEKNSCLNPFVKQLADKLAKHARKLKKSKDDKSLERAKSFYGLSVAFQKAKYVNPAIFMLKGFDSILITREDLDRHKNLLNCLNGVVDLQTEKLYPHRAPDLITQQTRALYRPNYRNPIVDNFLASIMPDEEVREALLRWLGYCLTGEISEQCAHFWTGQGSNGKSTLIDFLLYLLGTYATKLPVQAVVETREAEANATTTHLNCLVGRRLAVVNEFKPNHRLDVQQFKDLTGDKFLDIRRLHHERETIELLAKLILNGNELPRLNNTDSYALNRRIRALRFEQTFSLERGNLDPALPKKLATPDACAAMLSILVPHAAAWYRDSEAIGTGLLEATAMKAAKTEYLSENDFIEEFFCESCTFANATAEIPIKDFEERLKAAFPYETMESRIRKKDLRAQIQAKALNHGATVAIDNHRTKILKGVGWLLTAEFAGAHVDPRDIP